MILTKNNFHFSLYLDDLKGTFNTGWVDIMKLFLLNIEYRTRIRDLKILVDNWFRIMNEH